MGARPRFIALDLQDQAAAERRCTDPAEGRRPRRHTLGHKEPRAGRRRRRTDADPDRRGRTDTQAQLAEALAAAGYVADRADNGVDAHFLGDSEPYDAVILDLGLPRMDGITVLRKWRATGRTMPVLILTARDGWHEKVAGIDAGADDYLTKLFHGRVAGPAARP